MSSDQGPLPTLFGDAPETLDGSFDDGGEDYEAAQPPGPGDHIGRYMILDQLGAGGMGVVYAAFDPKLDRRIALKLLRPTSPSRTKGSRRARLLREAQAMAQLSHPNVVAVNDAGTIDDRVFIAMEFLDGKTLGQWLRSRGSWEDALALLIPVGRGILAIHDAGLVHRDVKPDNIMIDADGRPRVMDLGLARLDGASSSSGAMYSGPDRFEQPITQDGALVGTPGYIAPELYKGLEADALSDQFGYCVTLYEALYGVRPHEGETPGEIAAAVLEGRTRAPTAADVPPRLGRAILRGLAVEPSRRWPGLGPLLRELELAGKKRGPYLGAIAALGVVGALLGAYALWPEQVCADAGATAHDVWNDKARFRLKENFTTASVGYGELSALRVGEALDTYLADWKTMRTNVCLTANNTGDKLLDLRMACLDDRLRGVDALLEVFDSADAAVVQRSVAAVGSLPTLARCADDEALTSSTPPPHDEAVARKVSEAFRSLDACDALARAGKNSAARREFKELLSGEAVAQYAPLRARAYLGAGSLEARAGRTSAALEQLHEAYAVARSIRDAELSSRAALAIVGLQTDAGRIDEGKRWLRIADAELTAWGSDELRPLYVRAEARIFKAGDNIEQATERLSAAVETSRERGEPLLEAELLADLARVRGTAGEIDEPIAMLQRASELISSQLGSDHPSLATIEIESGHLADFQGRHISASEHYRRAAELISDDRGDFDMLDAQDQLALANAFEQLGEYDEAVIHAMRSVDILSALVGESDPRLGQAMADLAGLRLEMDQYEPALKTGRRAVEIFERAYGPDSVELSRPLVTMTSALNQLGRREEALMHVRRAAEVTKDIATGPRAGIAHAHLARAQLFVEDYEGAAQSIQISLGVGLKMLGPEDPRLGGIYGMGAVALDRLGRRDEANEYVAAAIASQRKVPDPSREPAIVQVERIVWIARDLATLKRRDDARRLLTEIEGRCEAGGPELAKARDFVRAALDTL